MHEECQEAPLGSLWTTPASHAAAVFRVGTNWVDLDVTREDVREAVEGTAARAATFGGLFWARLLWTKTRWR